jgi:hypothetical protein
VSFSQSVDEDPRVLGYDVMLNGKYLTDVSEKLAVFTNQHNIISCKARCNPKWQHIKKTVMYTINVCSDTAFPHTAAT